MGKINYFKFVDFPSYVTVMPVILYHFNNNFFNNVLISGFVITKAIFEEYQNKRDISLIGFYIQ